MSANLNKRITHPTHPERTGMVPVPRMPRDTTPAPVRDHRLLIVANVRVCVIRSTSGRPEDSFTGGSASLVWSNSRPAAHRHFLACA